jgi:hypothetical protein
MCLVSSLIGITEPRSCCQPSTELPGHLQSHYMCLLAAGVLANIVMPHLS